MKVGKVDLDSEFAFDAADAPFVQSSFGITPTILVAPTYPDPATSVKVFARPVDGFANSFGIYDGSQAAGINTANFGPKYFFTGTNGYLLIPELTARWKLADGTLPGRLTAGG